MIPIICLVCAPSLPADTLSRSHQSHPIDQGHHKWTHINFNRCLTATQLLHIDSISNFLSFLYNIGQLFSLLKPQPQLVHQCPAHEKIIIRHFFLFYHGPSTPTCILALPSPKSFLIQLFWLSQGFSLSQFPSLMVSAKYLFGSDFLSMFKHIPFSSLKKRTNVSLTLCFILPKTPSSRDVETNHLPWVPGSSLGDEVGAW